MSEFYREIEFLSDSVVQFESDEGICVWDIDSKSLVIGNPRQIREEKVLDYDLASNLALILDRTGKLSLFDLN